MLAQPFESIPQGFPTVIWYWLGENHQALFPRDKAYLRLDYDHPKAKEHD